MTTSKINFIHIPKNAGTSFRELCKSYPNLFVYNYHNVDVFDENIQNQLIILQNPVARFKSAVRFCFLPPWSKEPQIKYLNSINLNTPEKWVNILKNSRHSQYKNIMKEILNRTDTNIHYIGDKKLLYKYTYTPQIYYVNKPKYVILMENLESEVALLIKKLGINYNLKKINITLKNADNDYLSEENIRWVENEFYKEDYDLYNGFKDMPVEVRLDL